MRRITAILVLILATAVIGQPVLHNHPFTPTGVDHPTASASQVVPCAVCATANVRIAVSAPVLVAPAPAHALFEPAGILDGGVEPARCDASRAPPVTV